MKPELEVPKKTEWQEQISHNSMLDVWPIFVQLRRHLYFTTKYVYFGLYLLYMYTMFKNVKMWSLLKGNIVQVHICTTKWMGFAYKYGMHIENTYSYRSWLWVTAHLNNELRTQKCFIQPKRMHLKEHEYFMTMTMTIFYSTIDIQIEIIMYNSLENQIKNWSGDHY